MGEDAMVEIIGGNPLSGTLAAPSSKSVTNRALVLAALAEGTSTVRSPLESDDTKWMRATVSGLGASVEDGSSLLRVRGTGGRPAARTDSLYVGQSGTTMRFATALAAVASGEVEIRGSDDLNRRPIEPLTTALRGLGAHVSDTGGRPPVRVRGRRLAGGCVEVDARSSSQFVSAVLMVAPYAASDVTVEVIGGHASGYVALTRKMMTAFQVRLTASGERIHLPAPQCYQASDLSVPPDASAACHLFALAMATGGRITVSGLLPHCSQQPDIGLLAVLEAMGGRLSSDGGAVTVEGPAHLQATEVDLGAMPDQLPTVAVLAALARGTSRLRNAAVARLHECDRIAAVARELRKLAVAVEEHPDGLSITGRGATESASIDPHGDHRMAMAFAALGAHAGGIRLRTPDCVQKTYPDFWRDAARLGLETVRHGEDAR